MNEAIQRKIVTSLTSMNDWKDRHTILNMGAYYNVQRAQKLSNITVIVLLARKKWITHNV